MAIHPVYADAILDGAKQVEFRKRKLAEDITTVVIYATAPVQRVIGEFRIRETVVDDPESIWVRFGDVGVIDRDAYGAYYANSDHAVAFVVDEATRYERPQSLKELSTAPSVPQSFSYMPPLSA
jgi:predicted transcriptional regulator